MNVKRCKDSDLPGLLDHCRLVIRETDDMAIRARWEYGWHPTEAVFAEHVSRGMANFTEDGAELTAGVALTPFQQGDCTRFERKGYDHYAGL